MRLLQALRWLRKEFGPGAFGKVCAAARSVKNRGEEVSADSVLMEFLDQNPGLCPKPGDRDWDEFFTSFLEFLEKLMPLIEKLIVIFGMFG